MLVPSQELDSGRYRAFSRRSPPRSVFLLGGNRMEVSLSNSRITRPGIPLVATSLKVPNRWRRTLSLSIEIFGQELFETQPWKRAQT